MPKRKRENNVTSQRGRSGDATGQRRAEVDEKLVHGKKMLNRALKTAKGFEWQKLVKRIGHAKEKGSEAEGEVVRLERELKVLKVSHLQSCLWPNLACSWRLGEAIDGVGDCLTQYTGS